MDIAAHINFIVVIVYQITSPIVDIIVDIVMPCVVSITLCLPPKGEVRLLVGHALVAGNHHVHIPLMYLLLPRNPMRRAREWELLVLSLIRYASFYSIELVIRIEVVANIHIIAVVITIVDVGGVLIAATAVMIVTSSIHHISITPTIVYCHMLLTTACMSLWRLIRVTILVLRAAVVDMSTATTGLTVEVQIKRGQVP